MNGEFDADVKIEQTNIITMMKNQKVHIKTLRLSKKKDILIISALEETKNSNLFHKSRTQFIVKCRIYHEEIDLEER